MGQQYFCSYTNPYVYYSWDHWVSGKHKLQFWYQIHVGLSKSIWTFKPWNNLASIPNLILWFCVYCELYVIMQRKVVKNLICNHTEVSKLYHFQKLPILCFFLLLQQVRGEGGKIYFEVSAWIVLHHLLHREKNL